MALPGSEEMCPLAFPTFPCFFSAFLLGRGNSTAGSMLYRKGLLFTDTTALLSKPPGQNQRPLSHSPSAAPRATSAKAPQPPPHLPCAHRTSPPAAGKAVCSPHASVVGGQLALPRLVATASQPHQAAETQHWYCLQDGLQPRSWACGTVNSNQIPNEWQATPSLSSLPSHHQSWLSRSSGKLLLSLFYNMKIYFFTSLGLTEESMLCALVVRLFFHLH